MQVATSIKATTGVKSIPAGPISVDEIKDSIKGGKEAQIRQTYKKEYASRQVENEFKDSLFDADELGLTKTEYTEERVTWIPVSNKHKVKDVEKALEANPDARIYRVLSLKPIIESGQSRVLSNGLTGEALENFLSENKIKGDVWTAKCSQILLDKIAERQLVVYGENNDADMEADEPVLHNGQKQYRATFFSLTAREDIDLRVETKQEMPGLVLATQEVEEEVEA